MCVPYAVGIDVGGTKLAAALVARDGAITARTFQLTPTGIDAAGLLRLLGDLVAQVTGDVAPAAIAGIGLALPAFIDYPAQRVMHCVNLPLDAAGGCDVAAELARATGLTVTIDNDANAAAIGEGTWGAARDVRDFIMVTLGTGVGGGLVLDGKPYRGWRGLGAELGHIVVNCDDDTPCPCGGVGHLEAYVARPALTRAARLAATGPQGGALMRACGGDASGLDAEMLLDVADGGDPAATAVLSRAGSVLGTALSGLVNLLNPQMIVIGGGLGMRADSLFAAADAQLRACAPPALGDLQLVRAQLGNDAGLLGAAALAFQRTDGAESAADTAAGTVNAHTNTNTDTNTNTNTNTNRTDA
jgi:glucokinase